MQTPRQKPRRGPARAPDQQHTPRPRSPGPPPTGHDHRRPGCRGRLCFCRCLPGKLDHRAGLRHIVGKLRTPHVAAPQRGRPPLHVALPLHTRVVRRSRRPRPLDRKPPGAAAAPPTNRRTLANSDPPRPDPPRPAPRRPPACQFAAAVAYLELNSRFSALAAVAVYVGISSFLFHARNTVPHHRLDLTGVALLAPAVLDTAVARVFPLTEAQQPGANVGVRTLLFTVPVVIVAVFPPTLPSWDPLWPIAVGPPRRPVQQPGHPPLTATLPVSSPPQATYGTLALAVYAYAFWTTWSDKSQRSANVTIAVGVVLLIVTVRPGPGPGPGPSPSPSVTIPRHGAATRSCFCWWATAASTGRACRPSSASRTTGATLLGPPPLHSFRGAAAAPPTLPTTNNCSPPRRSCTVNGRAGALVPWLRQPV